MSFQPDRRKNDLEVDRLQDETRQNTKDIGILTTTVKELATMFRYAEKEYEHSRQDMKEVVVGLKTLNEKIGAMDGVQKEIGILIGEVGKLRHDIKNVEHAQQAIPILKENLIRNDKMVSDHETRVDALEKWKDEKDGAFGAVKVVIHSIWAFTSIGGLSFIAWLLRGYWAGGAIGGE